MTESFDKCDWRGCEGVATHTYTVGDLFRPSKYRFCALHPLCCVKKCRRVATHHYSRVCSVFAVETRWNLCERHCAEDALMDEDCRDCFESDEGDTEYSDASDASDSEN
jgi:hypothetical protein